LAFGGGEVFMAQAEWNRLLSDLHSVLDLERAMAAAEEVRRMNQRSHLPFLRRLLRDTSFFVREVAAAPYAALEGIRALPLLLEAHEKGIADGHDNDGLDAVITDLVQAQSAAEIAPLLLRRLRKRSASDRAAAAWLLGFVASEVSPEPLLRCLKDKSTEVRSAAAAALSSFPGQSGVLERLAEVALNDEDRGVRRSAISSLGWLGDRGAIPTLLSIIQDPAQEDSEDARMALKRLKG
jgi:HEAT repeat protein